MAAASPSAPVVPEHRPVSPAPSAPSANPYIKGSYVSPERDATDERDQKELNFSLDEARVIAEINPQMLSLRELYTVAISYKNIPEQFYKIIDISVKIYPARPVANLNAAAAAIERGNTQAAGRYLQMASHETLAYKNCRGAYELLCNNTYEGIRLLKAAKAEGSEEATYNLKIFLESNQTNIQKNMKTRYVLSCLLLGGALSVSAQKMAVKSNLLSAANGALNAGVEYAFGSKSTFDLSGSIRPWKRSEGYVNKYWLIQPEYRYWTCQKFNGSIWGAYLNGAQINVGG